MTEQSKLSADGLDACAYERRWSHDGEVPTKVKNENGRMAWPFKFKLLPLTKVMLVKDDEPLCSLTDAQRLVSQLHEELAQRDAEVERLRRFEAAYIEWQEKTEWVQADAKPKELGKHRADVLRERIDALSANHHKSGFCGDPYVHDCGRSDCPLSDSFKDQGK